MAPGNVLLRSRHETLFWVMLIVGAISGEGANPTNTLRGVNLHYELDISGEGANPTNTLRGVNLHYEAAVPASQGERALGETCVDNVSGIRSSDGSGDVCCNAKCPACGGEGCSYPSSTELDASDCCISFIRDAGIYCDDTSEGPCIIGSSPSTTTSSTGSTSAPTSTTTSSSTCSNGFSGIESSGGDVCCAVECGRCGGSGCSDLTGGEDNCCVGKIYDNGGLCTTEGAAPCIIYDDTDEEEASEVATGTTTVSSTPTTTPTPQPMSYYAGYVVGTSYIGCFEETGSDPFSYRVEITGMTPELCYAECTTKDALYMGLMGSNECACGEDEDYLDSDKTSGTCDSVCEGDDSICGGVDSFGLYKFLSSSSDSGTFHKSDLDHNGEIDGYAYKKCYDFDGEEPFDAVVGDEGMTPEMCYEICTMVSARYFGVYAGKECGCGSNSDYIVFGGTPGTCDMSCAGDSDYSCGGTEAYDMYQLVDNNIGLDDDSPEGGLLECSNGLAGVESSDGSVCCAAACGSCDGSRCVGTGGCCAEYIKAKYDTCSEKQSAPCVMD